MMTLVLDMSYRPISAVPFTRAMRYIVNGKVDVLESYDRNFHPDWQMPAVVRLAGWIDRRQRQVRFSRQNVLARDRWRCVYCGQRRPTEDLTFDHVIPKARGGKTTWDNIVTACTACNLKKGCRTPREAGMTLRRKPVQPKWLPLFSLSNGQISKIPPEWRNYWTVALEP